MASLFRNWLIRGVILAVIASVAYAGWFATTWVSPEKVRAALVAHLSKKLGDNVEVHVGDAHLRLFGGITVNDLRLTRRGEKEPFVSIPSAVIFHEKEHLHRGELTIRKIELDRPTLRLTRSSAGEWNLPSLTSSGTSTEPLPTLLVRDATLWLSDGRPDGLPPLVLLGVRLQIMNDPYTVLKVDAQASLAAADAVSPEGNLKPNTMAIPLTISAKIGRQTGQMSLRLSVPDLELTPDFAPLIARLNPKMGAYASQLSAKAALTVELATNPDPEHPLKYDVKLDLREGRFEDAMLPWPVEQVAGTIRCQDGRITVEKLSAKLGHATAELSVRCKPGLQLTPATQCTSKRVGPIHPSLVIAEVLKQTRPCLTRAATGDDGDPIRAIEDALERIDLSVTGLSLDDDLFARLTPQANRLREMFNPTGGVNVSVRFQRTDLEGGWRREVEVQPNKLAIEYEKFRYRVTDLTGSLKKVTTSDGTDEYQVNMIGSIGGRRVDLSGKVAGDGPDPYIAIRIAGSDIPVDDVLFSALKPKFSDGLKKLRANARGDFVVDINQDYQVNRAVNTFHIRVFNGTVNYTHFPYPFQQVRGNVRIRTEHSDPTRPLRPGLPIGSAGEDSTRLELKNFEAVHDGGRLWLSGENDAIPGTEDRKLTLRLQGENCPIDADFHAAMKELKLDGTFRSLGAKGELTFGADMEVVDRSRDNSVPESAVKVSTSLRPVATVLPGQPPFLAEKDLRLAFHFKGPSIAPGFFPYEMHNLAGLLRYQGGRLELVKMSARHGPTELRLDAGEMRFADGGEVWANLGGLTVTPLTADAALLRALPGKLKNGLQELNLRGPAELQVKHLVVRIPPTHAATEGPVAIHVDTATDATLARTESPVTTRPTTIVRGQAPDDTPTGTDRWRVLGSDGTDKKPQPAPAPALAAIPSIPLPRIDPPHDPRPILTKNQPIVVPAINETPVLPAVVTEKTPEIVIQTASSVATVPITVPPEPTQPDRKSPPVASIPVPPIPESTPHAPSEAPESAPHAPREVPEIKPVAITETIPATPTDIKPATPPGRFPFTLPWQKNPPKATKPAETKPTSPSEEQPAPIIYWNVVLKLNGAAIDVGMSCDDVYGSIASVGRYEGNHMGAVTGNAWFDKATIAKQPIASAKVGYRVRPQQPDPMKPGSYLPPAIEFHDLTASLFQGVVAGEGRVVLADPIRYRVWLTATGVQLEDLARHYKLASGAELRGTAQGQLLIENVLDPKTGQLVMSGGGQVDVPRGRMYNLPVLLDLVKVLKGQAPDGCAFEEAHASFELKGDRVKVTQLDLLGSAVSLGGSGEMDLDGKHVKFEFYTIWSQTLKRWLSTPLGDVTGLLSGSLFKIELTRENGTLVPKAHMLPVVSDPVRAVAERLRNRVGRSPEIVPAGR